MISFGKFYHGLKGKRMHPQKDENGRSVRIATPSIPTDEANWHDSTHPRVFPVNQPVPSHLNGIPFDDKAPAPSLPHAHLDDLGPFQASPETKRAAGVLIVEPDKSVWVTEPTNHFGYRRTFPKGTMRDNENMQSAAQREAHEETGLHIQLTGVLGDYERSTSKARYYIGKRIGGSPSNMGWETQAMHLVPLHQLDSYMHDPMDKHIARELQNKLADN